MLMKGTGVKRKSRDKRKESRGQAWLVGFSTVQSAIRCDSVQGEMR
jgi:hypothetical protein